MKQSGAREIHLAVTHGLFCAGAIECLQKAPINGLFVTDSVPMPEEQQIPHLHLVPVAPLLGEAVKRIHRNESVSRLFV
jgi:ribose-phosphate pyrophosphokinase